MDKFLDLTEYIASYDIVFLSETCLKPSHNFNIEINGFKMLNIYRSKTKLKAKRGSGGILVYIKENIISGVTYLTHLPCVEDRIWIKLSEHYFGWKRNMYFCSLYVSPENSSHVCSALSLWNYLRSEVSLFSKSGLILTRLSDFNARIGLLPDYGIYDHSNHFLPLPPHYVPDSLSPSTSMDKHINNECTKVQNPRRIIA